MCVCHQKFHLREKESSKEYFQEDHHYQFGLIVLFRHLDRVASILVDYLIRRSVLKEFLHNLRLVVTPLIKHPEDQQTNPPLSSSGCQEEGRIAILVSDSITGSVL